jgi:hypothetical protein
MDAHEFRRLLGLINTLDVEQRAQLRAIASISYDILLDAA